MELVVGILVLLAAAGVAVTVMLVVRAHAPAGGYFADGDRAAGVFGVLATGFPVLLGFIVFLAFESYDQSRTGAEAEALLVAQQFETAQLMPPEVRAELSGALVCYARWVVASEWPAMEDGTLGETISPWGVRLFRILRGVEPVSNSEQSAYDTWIAQEADRQAARSDRVHGASGVIPAPVWIVLILTAGLIFGYMLVFADSAERWWVQAVLMGSVVTVMTATLLVITALDDPYAKGVGALSPRAMGRTLLLLEQEQEVAGLRRIPCRRDGAPLDAG